MGAGIPAHLQGGGPLMGLGEPTVPAVATWAGLSWRTDAASEGSVSALFWLSPTPLLPKRGRRSWEHVVFVLCFWPAQWHCGCWQSCQGKHWNSELHMECQEKVSKSVGRARKLTYLCGQSPLLHSFLKSFCSWPVWLTVLPAPKIAGSVTGQGTCHGFRLHLQ